MLLLDEPTEGLAPAIIDELAELLAEIVARKQMSIIVVEQNVAFTLRLTQPRVHHGPRRDRRRGHRHRSHRDEMVDQYLGV